jgi:putative transposase
MEVILFLPRVQGWNSDTVLSSVDPWNALQVCSTREYREKNSFYENPRTSDCRFVADGDSNAAVKIHRVGMEQPFEPVESIPLHHIPMT